MKNPALDEYQVALRIESRAWRALADRLPGSLNFSQEAWLDWLSSVKTTNDARAKWVQNAQFQPDAMSDWPGPK
jgi:uncharacterized membrane protein